MKKISRRKTADNVETADRVEVIVGAEPGCQSDYQNFTKGMEMWAVKFRFPLPSVLSVDY